jgi:hypothetical protein
MQRADPKTLMRLAGVVAVCAAACTRAGAQPFPAAARGEYQVQHGFNIRVQQKPGAVYLTNWDYRVYALERDRVIGVASDRAQGTRTYAPGPVVGGGVLSDSVKVGPFAPVPIGWAEAAFTASVANGRLTGDTTAKGRADIVDRDVGRKAVSESFSKVKFRTGTADANGKITWNPRWRVGSTSRGNARARGRDPITVEALDLDTGVMVSTVLWDASYLIDGNGVMDWGDGRISFEADEFAAGEFAVLMDSPYLTSGVGGMSFAFEGGVLTASDDWGVFDGLLPAVGAAPTFVVPFGDADGAIDLDFDLASGFVPKLRNVNGYELGVAIENGGEAEASAIPSPASVSLVAGGLLIAVAPRRRRG